MGCQLGQYRDPLYPPSIHIKANLQLFNGVTTIHLYYDVLAIGYMQPFVDGEHALDKVRTMKAWKQVCLAGLVAPFAVAAHSQPATGYRCPSPPGSFMLQSPLARLILVDAAAGAPRPLEGRNKAEANWERVGGL